MLISERSSSCIFASVALAVADANTNFSTGNVTYNVCAGHTETLTAALALTATGSSGNDIIFQKSGARCAA